MQKYVADFETSTEKWLAQDNGVARVWAACMVTVAEQPKVVTLETNLDKFMDTMFACGNCEVYYHNLKYDGEYVIAWLFNHGYKYDASGKKSHTFNCIISDMGAWYKITITHKIYKKRYVRTHIYDSLKKLPMKVSEIAKAFKLTETKGEIDYNLYRPVGYQLNANEREYIINDCVIVAKALYMQFAKGLDKMTVGSDALASFKDTIGGKRAFTYLFPTLPVDVDNDLRQSYKGGFVMCNPKYVNKSLTALAFDINSLYPTAMYGKLGTLPYGYPQFYKGKYKYDREYPLYIQKLSCRFKLKPYMIPTIQLKGNMLFCPTEYVSDSKDVVDLVLTSVDLDLLFEHYDVTEIRYDCGYKFKATASIFQDYIDHWAKIKAESTGGLRSLAKLMLNSLYGKFATNPTRQNKIPVETQGEVTLQLQDPEIGKPVYTAMGAFVTARARAFTISTSQKFYNNWVYSDTDSMYLTGLTEEQVSKFIEVHPTNLGAWKLEHHVKRGKWLRPKTYIMDSYEDGLQIRCAGMPDNIKAELISKGDAAFDAFTYGAAFDGKLQPKRTKGGVVLCDTTFTIAE